jgi:branched-chain amino acid transport system substrate-binding protein
VADRSIHFVAHCCASHLAVALSEAIERHNARQPDNRMLLLVEVGDWDVVNDKCSFWTFSFYASGEMMLEALTHVAATQPSIKRVYLVNQDYVWGHINQRFVRGMLGRKRPDIEIVGDDLVPLGKVKDFAPYVAKIKAAKADAVFTGNWGPDLVLLIKAAADAKLAVSFYAPAGLLWGTVTAMGDSASIAGIPTCRSRPSAVPETNFGPVLGRSTTRCRQRTSWRCWRLRSRRAERPTLSGWPSPWKE